MSEYRFAGDKPKDCKYCYWWSDKDKGCDLGGFHNCYYRLPEIPETKKKSGCAGCPYGTTGKPCVGFCLRAIMTDGKEGIKNAG